jgi:hypothetical protein
MPENTWKVPDSMSELGPHETSTDDEIRLTASWMNGSSSIEISMAF